MSIEDSNIAYLPLADIQSRSDKKIRAMTYITLISLALVTVLTAVCITLAVLYGASNKGTGLPKYPAKSMSSSLGKYGKGAVTADNVYCSEVGRDILIRGGNAVDAVIATMLCQGVMNPQSSGLGGGHFMTIYNATERECYVVDAREVAPIAANQTMFVGRRNASKSGWLAIGIPGELHGLRTEYEHFGGRLPWKMLWQPAIQRQKAGVPVGTELALNLKEEAKILLKEPTLKYLFTKKGLGERLLEEGDIMPARPRFLETLRALALSRDPIRLFYRSQMITANLVTEIQNNGGLIRMADFARYKSIVRRKDEVIVTKLSGGRSICSPPPPSGSAVTASILKIIDGFQFDQTTFGGNVDLYHRYIEASKFAYAYRSRLGDMAFVNDSLAIAKYITSDPFAHKIRGQITNRAHPSDYYGAKYANGNNHGTTHITVMDRWGNTVSVTTTIDLPFGAKVRSESTGILWNCQMDDFSTPGHANAYGFLPSPANFIQSGKRPQSSISPLIFFSHSTGQALMALGSAGGSAIISGTATVALRTLWLDWDLKSAIDAPRFHNQFLPNTTVFEKGFPYELLTALQKRGQSMEMGTDLNVVTGCLKKDNFIFANSDFRKGSDSNCAGY